MSIKFDIRSAAAALLSTRSAEKQAAMEKKAARAARRGNVQVNYLAISGLYTWQAMEIPQTFHIVAAPTSCDLPSYVEMANLERQLKDKVVGMEGRKTWEQAEANRQLEETLAANSATIGHCVTAVEGIKALKTEALKAKAFAEQVDRHISVTASQMAVSDSVTQAFKEALTEEYTNELEELNNLLADW